MCVHNWKTIRGLFKEYKDCTKCGMKWEDYINPPKTEKKEETPKAQEYDINKAFKNCSQNGDNAGYDEEDEKEYEPDSDQIVLSKEELEELKEFMNGISKYDTDY